MQIKTNNDIINLCPNKKTLFDYRSVVGKEGRGGILLPGSTDITIDIILDRHNNSESIIWKIRTTILNLKFSLIHCGEFYIRTTNTVNK